MKVNTIEDSDQYINLDNRVTNCSKVIVKLKDSSYKDKIMKECREYFYDKTFMDKLNDKKHLIGFENGVYDLDRDEFREGLPDDYVSLSTGLTLPVINKDMPIKIKKIIEEVQTTLVEYEELSHGLNDFLEKVFQLALPVMGSFIKIKRFWLLVEETQLSKKLYIYLEFAQKLH